MQVRKLRHFKYVYIYDFSIFIYLGMTIAILTVIVLLLRFVIEEFFQRLKKLIKFKYSLYLSIILDMNHGVINIGVVLFDI